MTFAKDFQDGMRAEARVYSQLKEFDPTVKSTYTSCVVDFVSEDRIYELKKRNCKKNTYPTTIVGYNKLQYADKQDKRLVLLFEFTDGLYYCEYTKDMIYSVQKFVRNKRSDYNDHRKDYVYIPVEQLKPISTFKNYFDRPTATV